MSFNLGSAHGEIVIDYNGAGVQQAMGDLSSLQAKGTALMKAGGVMLAGGAAIGGVLLGATNAAADFEFQMDAVNAALGGLDASQMEVVEEQALAMGAATKFSAGEVAGVQEALAKSGLNAEQVTGGATQSVLDLAAATGESLVPSAQAAASAINLFGLDAAQTAAVADIFTAGLNNSNATLTDFQRGVNNLGPVMANLNQYAGDGEKAFQDTAAAVAYFNAQGLKAADAGVSLARGLTNLATPTSAAATRMTELGIAAFDAQGDFIGFPELFDQLNVALADSSDAYREETLSMLFGAEAQDVMNKAVKEGGDPLREMQELLESQGQAAEQAAIRQDNLRGALEQLGGALQTAGIVIGSTFIEPIRALAEAITGLVQAFLSLPAPVQQAIAVLAALAAGFLIIGGGVLVAIGAFLAFGPAIAAALAVAAPFLVAILAIAAALALLAVAYKTNFLGFADAVNGALGKAQKTIKAFGAGFEAAFNRGKLAGLNDIANGVQAFGDALLFATGIDITGFTDRLSAGIQAFGDSMEQALAAGASPLQAVVNSLGDAFAAMGLPQVAEGFYAISQAMADFGAEWEKSFAANKAAGMSDLEAGLRSFGDALEHATGLPVEGVFNALAAGVAAVLPHLQNLANAIKSGLSAALDGLTNNVIPGAISALGNYLGTIKDVVGALLGGDFAQAGQIAGDAIQAVSDWAGDTADAIRTVAQNVGDTLASIDFGGIIGGIASGIGDALGNIASTVAGLVTGIDWSAVVGAIGTTLGAAFGAIGSFIGNVAGAIASALGAVFATVGGLIQSTDWSAVVQAVGNALGAAFGAIGGWLQTVAQAISTALQNAFQAVAGLIGGVDWSGIVQTIGNSLGAAFGAVGGWIASVAQSIATALQTAFSHVAGLVGSVDWSGLVQAIGAAISTAFGAIGGWLTNIGQTIADALGNVLSTIDALLPDIAVFDTLSQAVSGAALAISNFGSLVGPALTTVLAKLGELKDALSGIDFSGVAQAVGSVALAFANFGSLAQVALEQVKTAFENLPLPTDLDGVATALEGIKTAISGWTMPDLGGVAEAITAIGSAAEGALKAVQDFFGALGQGFGGEGDQTMGTFATDPLSEALAGASDQAEAALTESGDFATNFIAGIAASFAQADWTPVSTAINAGLQSVLTGVGSGGMSTQAAKSPQTGDGGGLGAQLATSMVASIAAAFTPEIFAPIKTAFDAALSAAFAAATGGKGGGGEGGQGTTIAASIVSSIAAGLGAQTATLSAALQAVVTAAGAAITGLEVVGTQIMTQISAGIGPATGTLIAALSAAMTAMIAAATSLAVSANTVGTALVTAIGSGIGAATGTLTAAVTAAMTAAIAAGNAAAAGATAVGTTFVTQVGAGIGAGTGAVTAAVQAMVAAGIDAANAAAAGAYNAGVIFGQSFADGILSAVGAVTAASNALVEAAAAGLAAAAQIASPSKLTMGMGEDFGAGFAMGIAGAGADRAQQASYDMGLDSIHALAESLRSNAEAKAARLRGIGDNIRENQGWATGGGGQTVIETTGTVEMDGEQMGTFTVETVLGGLIGTQRKGGRRRGRMAA